MTSGGVPDHRADVALDYGDADAAHVVAAALTVESRAGVPRASARVTREGTTVHLSFSARDAAALRAVVNSYLRWARVAEEAAGVVRDRAAAGT